MHSYDDIRMKAYYAFDSFQYFFINTAVKTIYRYKVKHQFLNKTDTLTKTQIKAIKEYWRPYKHINTNWHKLYSSRNGNFDVRYLPEDLYFTRIDQFFNDRRCVVGVNDKNYYDVLFADVKRPKTIGRLINGIQYDADYKITDIGTILSLCHKEGKVIIKPARDSGGGKGISFWDTSASKEELQILLKNAGRNYIIQEVVKQNSELENIHEESLNTIRITTMLFKDKIYLLSSVLRMGVDKGKLDNAHSGGISCGIKEDGTLRDVAFSVTGIKYDCHPQGFHFGGFTVPAYKELSETTMRLQERMANFRLISWDFAVSRNNEPILIEANMKNGGLEVHQFNNGPLFGDMTDIVLKEVFKEA